jgi:hypothetical protein
MSSRRVPVVRNRDAVRETTDTDAVEVIDPAARGGGFFSFSYSITEVSAAGGRTRVTSKSTRLENGKLTSEAFEGELDGSAHARLVRQAQQQLVGQAALMLQSLGGWLLPFARRPDRD